MGKRKTIDRKPIEEWLERAINRYELESGKKYDWSNGCDQVFKGNHNAYATYKVLTAIKIILNIF